MGNLDKFFESPAETNPFDPDSKFAVLHDKWDDEDYQEMMEDIKELGLAEESLLKIAQTGSPAFADSFWSLLHSVAIRKDKNDVRPSHRLNHVVNEELTALPNFAAQRHYSVGDPIAAAWADVAMEPDLEKIFDRTQQEQQAAKELEEMLQQYMEMAQELADALAAGGDEGEDGEGDSPIQGLRDSMANLRAQIEAADGALDQSLDDARGKISNLLRQAVDAALDDAEAADSAALAWGMNPGDLARMTPGKRIEMSRKLRENDGFKRMALLFGAMLRMAQAAQRRKIIDAPEEVYAIEPGSDLSRLTSAELMSLADPDLELDFLRRYTDGELMNYKLRGTEKVAKGGIVVIGDGSDSMNGEKAEWERAVAMTLLHICKEQKRPFTFILFGGPGQIIKYVFMTPDRGFDCTRYYQNEVTELKGVDAVISLAECRFAYAGTDFMTPFNSALEQLNAEFDLSGAVNGDIVFTTDGQASVTDVWLKEYLEEKDRLKFKCYGIAIGSDARATSRPMIDLTDRAETLDNVIKNDGLLPIFEGV